MIRVASGATAHHPCSPIESIPRNLWQDVPAFDVNGREAGSVDPGGQPVQMARIIVRVENGFGMRIGQRQPTGLPVRADLGMWTDFGGWGR